MPHGKDDFTLDPELIAHWAQTVPGCNWGGVPPEDTIVLDIDPRNGGADSPARLERNHGPLPETRTAKSGGGGRHLWFTGTASRGKLTDYSGIDVKTHTGYVVLPPSVHASGAAYEWLDFCDPAPAPEWLQSLLNGAAPAAAQQPDEFFATDRRFTLAGAREYAERVALAPLRAAVPGERNSSLNSAAKVLSHFVENGFWTAEHVHSWCADVRPDLPADELRRTVNSALKSRSKDWHAVRIEDLPEPEAEPGEAALSGRETWPSPGQPLEAAHRLAGEIVTDGVVTLQQWRCGWWRYGSTHWTEVESAVSPR